MKRTLLTFLSFFIFLNLHAQTEYMVLLHSGEQIWSENARDYAEEAFISSQEAIDGNYYRFLQFNAIPGQGELNDLAHHGIELLEYIPNKAYVASIPVSFDVKLLPDLNVRSVIPIVNELKMRHDLLAGNLPDYAVNGNRVELMLKYYKNLRHDAVLDWCRNDGVKILAENGYNNVIRVSIPKDKIEDLSAMPYVAFLEPRPPHGEKEDMEGRSLHRANLIDTPYPGGRKYDGEGIGVMCRDDGAVGPHIDFHGRIDQTYVGPDRGTHGDGVSGIMAGAGNLDPRNRGMAAGADLWVTDYEADFLDETMDLFFNHNVIITNSSYSNGCNFGYTAITETVDMQLFDNQTLLHVFSAGNSNNLDCGYGAGNQWGNITGGHKQAKNCIATANLQEDFTLEPSSSRGPAHDGRIKPDIAAHGAGQTSANPNNAYQSFGGTSAAAPGIAGVSAMLQDAHKELNGDQLAPMPLIKGVLLNSANDMGNVGPDYRFGWGHVNAFRAALTLEENRYMSAEIMNGDTNTHTITIPGGIVEAKVMVYWADPQATVQTTKALVNDLDITMKMDTLEFLPWLLDPTPDPAILNTPAAKGHDHLNNVEQISIENPTPGDYTLEVHGFEVPLGAKEYWVIWEFRTSEIMVVYPDQAEQWVPGELQRIHWEAPNGPNLFQIFVSMNGGGNWSLIGSTTGTEKSFEWTVPPFPSGDFRVRVSRGAEMDESDGPNTIFWQPSGVKVEQGCPEYLRISWSPVQDATDYNVYRLGDKFMDYMGMTTDTFFDMPTLDSNPTLDHWFAVSANNANTGAQGRRTLAQQYNAGLLGCESLVNDIGIVSIDAPGAASILACSELDAPVQITLKNNGIVPVFNAEVSYQIDNNPFVAELIGAFINPGEVYTHTFSQNLTASTSGMFSLTASVNAPNDEAAFNNTASRDLTLQIFPGAGAPLGYDEDFESPVFPPDYYSIDDFDDVVTWEHATGITGIDGNLTNAASMPNRLFTDTGERDEFTTQPIELGDEDFVVMTFDLSYTTRGGTSDTLEVWVSDDCGFSFQHMGYKKFGPELITAATTNGVYIPQASQQWRTESVSLADFKNSSVVFKFVNINNGGNNLYIDNINVRQIDPPVSIIDASKTEVCKGKFVIFNSESTGEFLEYEWDFGPNASPMTGNDDGPHFVMFSQPGIQNVSLTTSNGAGSNTQILEINVIEDDAVAAFTFDNNNGIVTFTNTSIGGSEFFWDFGDNNTSNEENPVHIYAEPGDYTVTLIADNDCGDSNISETVNIITSTKDFNLNFSADIMPNPTSGLFSVNLTSSEAEDLTIELLDLRGILIQKENVKVGNFKTTQTFDATDLASGVYFVKIIGQGGFLTKRIVVE